MSIITRFAPSPTGFLHIGGARTALFNWLFSRHHGGEFLLRIEDTDQARASPEAEQAIFQGLKWLGLTWDGEPVFQSKRMKHHQEVADKLLEKGHAYRCYTTPQELEAMRLAARATGKPLLYNGYWRDRSPHEAPPGVSPAIRLKSPREGETVMHDLIQGMIRIQNNQLDDMVLLRADGTPTYMLSVVVDDHDMDITHVIRGDDHLTNTFRQLQIYHAMGWSPPEFAHIPLIHGPDGAKLSKRHGALSIQEYQKMGFLPEALRNYLLRLGWGHGDVELISTEEAIALFSLEDVGKAPARFDLTKLTSFNGHYIREKPDTELLAFLEKTIPTLTLGGQARLLKGMAGLKQRAKTLLDLQEQTVFYITDEAPTPPPEEKTLLEQPDIQEYLKGYLEVLKAIPSWDAVHLEEAARVFATSKKLKLGQLAQPLRIALTGRTVSPPIFDVAAILGPQITCDRLQQALTPNTENA